MYLNILSHYSPIISPVKVLLYVVVIFIGRFSLSRYTNVTGLSVFKGAFFFFSIESHLSRFCPVLQLNQFLLYLLFCFCFGVLPILISLFGDFFRSRHSRFSFLPISSHFCHFYVVVIIPWIVVFVLYFYVFLTPLVSPLCYPFLILMFFFFYLVVYFHVLVSTKVIFPVWDYYCIQLTISISN